jgi:hypothetical protein
LRAQKYSHEIKKKCAVFKKYSVAHKIFLKRILLVLDANL